MKRIAKFHKVSPEQFAKDWKDTFPAADDKEIQDTYEKISLPVRATAGSAGYDFFAPADIVLNRVKQPRFQRESVWKWSRTGY